MHSATILLVVNPKKNIAIGLDKKQEQRSYTTFIEDVTRKAFSTKTGEGH
jgi:hypothetical protein